MISYVRNHDLVRTQSLSRTYAIIFPYVRNHFPVRIRNDKIQPGDSTFPAPPPLKQIRCNSFRLPPVQVTPGGNLKLVSSYPL